MARLAAALDRQHPGWSPGRTAGVVTLQERLVGKVRPWLLLLLSAVGLVLLVACANMAGLMLMRTTMGRGDLCVRAALGASRWQLVRGPLTQALVLSLTGTAVGIVLAHGVVRVLAAWLPFGLPRVAAVVIDWRVVSVALGAAGVVGAGLRPDSGSRRDASRRAGSAGGWRPLDDTRHGWAPAPKRAGGGRDWL